MTTNYIKQWTQILTEPVLYQVFLSRTQNTVARTLLCYLWKDISFRVIYTNPWPLGNLNFLWINWQYLNFRDTIYRRLANCVSLSSNKLSLVLLTISSTSTTNFHSHQNSILQIPLKETHPFWLSLKNLHNYPNLITHLSCRSLLDDRLQSHKELIHIFQDVLDAHLYFIMVHHL